MGNRVIRGIMKTSYALAVLLVLLALLAGCTGQGTGGNQAGNQTGNQSETTIIGSWVQSGDSQNILIQFFENGTAQMRFRSTAGSTNDTFINRTAHWEPAGAAGLVNLSYVGPTSNETRILTLSFSNETAQVKKVYNATQETTNASETNGTNLSFKRAAEGSSQDIGFSVSNPLKK